MTGAFVQTYPVRGEPVGVKDLIDVEGQTVRNGTPGLGHRVAAQDATAWARMRAAGFGVACRTTVPELAWSGRTPGCGNPFDPTRDAGGSSGGSAVAVATGAVPVALGTDTGGSIRIPAALCGVAGLRPTHGSVPMDGITPVAPSMDTVGPIARTAAECLRIHGILAGESAGIEPAGGLRAGWPSQLWGDRIDPEVLRLVENAVAGLEITDVELPLARRHARGTGYTIMLFESARQWWARYQEQPDGLAGRAIGQLRAGSQVSTSDYEQALALAGRIRAEVDAVFDTVDVLVLPTVPVTAAPLDADTVVVNGHPEEVETAYYRLTALASVSGHPALTVPAGRTAGGLPAGVQIIGPRGQEALVCSIGEAIHRTG
ncbi:amidase [Amycolatopsis pithecellobii]|uniref:Amidase n=1 Tax=Amycolatopsis pithecellobii TaxID=664692 RepID=A0A6N7Z5J6_9PSEU|nr:amidase [Amycolatopsis pithecellobii]MTD56919.1 amidase [Amycolatopsis pithecellobii]